MDANWLQNALTYAATGERPFCELPTSRSLLNTWVTQTATFVMPTQDRYFIKSPPTSIVSCEYAVMSGPNAIAGPSDPSVKTTLAWSPRTCNGKVTITVGPTGNCRDKGKSTCLVFTRARNSNGEIGNTSYQEYSVSY